MKFATLQDWLNWLEGNHPKVINLGLDRLCQVAQHLPALEPLFSPSIRRQRIITVAGTNGKGSCVATLEALCRADGHKVGAYTSPHFLHYNERIRINGRPVSDAQIIDAFREIDEARGDVSLTYFEFGTLAALLIFMAADVDILLLEVGLGGRLDAVNLIDPDVAIVTSIDLDHQDWLGDDREAVGREKAGIFRPDVWAICADRDPPRSLVNVAREKQVRLLLADQDLYWSPSAGGWSWQGRGADGELRRFHDLPTPQLPVPSVAAAIQAFVLLGGELSRNRVAEIMAGLRLPGRCQRLRFRDRDLILDVAHNPAAARYLAQQLQPLSGSRIIAVMAAMADKDFGSIINILGPLVNQWFFCDLANIPRAARGAELLQSARDFGYQGQSCDSVDAGLRAALAAADPGDSILVVGSFFTVAAALAEVDAAESEAGPIIESEDA